MTNRNDVHAIVDAVATALGAPAVLDRVLPGGTHATTVVVTCRGRSLVARRFPLGDDAARRECAAHPTLARLGTLVPRLVAIGGTQARPVIITTVVPGTPPSPVLPVAAIAAGMARTLARIHGLSGAGLRLQPVGPGMGDGPLARRALAEFEDLDTSHRVLTHLDFWCGNVLWDGSDVAGVVDWSGACSAPRGVDLAWCRQDLVLLGDPDAAELFLREYQRLSGVTVTDIGAWDVQAAARAEDRVETWAPNYLGIGRSDGTAETLRARLDAWNATL